VACRPVETTVKVKRRNFWNPPFSYQIGELCTFVLFLMDAAAKEWEIYRMILRSMILRLTDTQSEFICLVSASELAAEEARELCQMLPAFPRGMSKPTKEKLAATSGSSSEEPCSRNVVIEEGKTLA
jgi:hypothetical protein